MSQKSTFGNMSRRLAWLPDVPHNDLPPIPPPIDLETRPVLKRCIGARAALAEVKQAASLLPNPTILINTLPLLEAQASSEIEHIVTTTDKLFRFVGVAAPLTHPREKRSGIATLSSTGSSGLLCEQESGREKLFVNSRLLTLLTTETDAVEPFRSASEDR